MTLKISSDNAPTRSAHERYTFQTPQTDHTSHFSEVNTSTTKASLKDRVSVKPVRDKTTPKIYDAAKKAAIFTFLGGALG